MHRKALVVGIDKYDNFPSLHYAEKDARDIASRLGFHADEKGEANFAVRQMISGEDRVTRAALRAAINKLFAESEGLDIAFYFSGHGHVTATEGYLITCDGETDDYGVSMQQVVETAYKSKASSVLIMLDCCHAGAAGNPSVLQGGAVLRENMTIMAASLPMQEAMESAKEGGLFTAALRDALDGAAKDFLGEITTASVYSIVEKRFSLWDQRPVAKSYVTRPIVLRKVEPRLSLQELRRIVKLFPTADYKYPLEPDYDPERDVNEVAKTPEVPAKVEVGRLFKRYRDAGLLCASSIEDLYYVAQRSHTVELTLFGREYWRMVKQGRV